MDDESLQNVFLEGLDHISEAGYSKPFTAMSLALKKELCDTLRCHFTVYRNIPVMNQLKTGLAELDVLDAMTRFPNLLEPFFVCDKQGPLTAGVYLINKFNAMVYARMILIIDGIKVLLDVNYSPRDSSERVKEEATYMLFLDLLYDCEGKRRKNYATHQALSIMLSFFLNNLYRQQFGTVPWTNTKLFHWS